jgi:hypothetical protein
VSSGAFPLRRVERLGTILIFRPGAHRVALDERALPLLSRFRFEWPTVDAAFLASLMRWAMLIVISRRRRGS